jgi:hypothetical protein
MNEHTPTPWYALSGGHISTSVTSDWASKEKLIGEAASEFDAERICFAHNEAIGRAISSVNEKRSEAPVNSYEAMKEQNEALLEALHNVPLPSVNGKPSEFYQQFYSWYDKALALAQTIDEGKAVRK